VLVASCAAPAPLTRPAAAPSLRLPTFIPFDRGPKPDLAGNAEGLDHGYFKFPSDLLTTVGSPPGDGSVVSAIMVQPLAPPPPAEQNTAWQAVNKALNARLSLTMVPNPDYPTRLAAVLAGSDLPDFIYDYANANPYGVIPSLPAFASVRCADLTPYLAGDAIKDYPNLAHYSTQTWRSGVIGGKLFAIPISRSPMANVMACRADLLSIAGVPTNSVPNNADEFKRWLQAVNRPQQNQYAFYSPPQLGLGLATGGLLSGVFNVPNNWRLDASGKLIKDFETEEYRAAVGFVRDLWAAQLFHPDTLSLSGAQMNSDFAAGRTVVIPAAWGQFPDLWNLTASANPQARVGALYPFSHDGGKPSYLGGPGNFGWTLIKRQSSTDRVKMLLRIADFFAAPFGSREWLLNFYGVEGIDFSFSAAGAPLPTDQGRAELTATWKYITSPAYPLFNPIRSQDYVSTLYPVEQAMLASLVADPTQGLYSETALTGASAAQSTFYAGVVDIVVGRRPIDDLTALVNEWRQRVGAQIRAELQTALQDSKT
jgi:putative aldouronate transport system substrate-binding protein